MSEQTADDKGPTNEDEEPVEWQRFACYCTGTRHYYVREPYGICPPAAVRHPQT